MYDFNKPWGFAGQPQKQMSNTLSPLGGGGGQEAAPGIVQTGAPLEDTMASALGTAVAGEAIKSGLKGATGDLTAKGAASILGNGASSAAGSQAAMLAEQTAGMGAEAAGHLAGSVGSSAAGMAGPLAAAAAGLAEGDYGKAGGAALGAAAGSMLGPLGTMVGGQLGGMLGGALFADGTTSVPGYADGTPGVQPQGGKAGAPQAAAAAPARAVGQFTELNNAYTPAHAKGGANPFAPVAFGPNMPQQAAGKGAVQLPTGNTTPTGSAGSFVPVTSQPNQGMPVKADPRTAFQNMDQTFIGA